MDRYFDQIYYSLSFVILAALAYSTSAGFTLRSLEALALYKKRALGITLSAVGTAIALLGGLSADLFLKSSPLFQQAKFAVFYIGFGLLVYGIDAFATVVQQTRALPGFLKLTKVTSSLRWIIFLGTLVISGFYLFNPYTFIINQNEAQVQLTIYFLLMLAISLIGALFLFLMAFEIRERGEAGHLVWTGAYLTMLFIGLLRESLIIRSLNNPLSDMLIAFVPFVVGSICLCFGVRSLLKNAARKIEKPDPTLRNNRLSLGVLS